MNPVVLEIIIGVSCALIFGVLGFVLGGLHRKKTAERTIGSANTEAARILNQAMNEAEAKKRESIIEAKDEIHKYRKETEAELRERRGEIQRQEKRLQQKEENIDRKTEAIEKKDEQLNSRLKSAEQKLAEAENIKKEQLEKLETITGLTQEQAKQLMLQSLEDKLIREKAAKISEYAEKIDQEKDELAREIITSAIQRCASDQVADAVITAVSLPDDSMKGRIIGREGRNIRAIEQITGVDLIVDDTPETIMVSCFDPVRREVARLTLEKLILDGRVHPARIEKLFEKSGAEVEQTIRKAGEKAAMDAGVHGIHRELIRHLGALKYRTSYGQNVLTHSIEVSYISGIMASELGLDSKMARRAGLLHDIGKAVDHQMEGTHIDLGVELAKKYHENDIVINAIASHHGDCEPTNLISCLVQAADAVSAARPGARRENIQAYIKRLEQLEEISESFAGVDKAYAIQAGREVRIIVKPEKVSDAQMTILARDISQKIENELQYPGQIKVNLIRELRVADVAK